MRVISRKRIKQFTDKHPEAKPSFDAWYRTAKKADWKSLAEVKTDFPHADLVGTCTVFNVGKNKYRLITKIAYRAHKVFIRVALTHAEYDEERWKDDCNC